MEIYTFSIQKSKSDNFDSEIGQYCKMSSKFANLSDKIIFNDKIARAQSSSRQDALRAYDEAYEPYLKGFCVALDENGSEISTQKFADLIANKSQISFFIGGAYGLSEKFKHKCDFALSLSQMTTAHKIAKLMLFEQIFRALCIIYKHPYHK
ncbi:MAG: 23S rRNA (pseudouridine(1915)-N(3))-methyltransferase RlmH [Campylobacter sp.]